MEYPYQLVAFFDKEPELGEFVYQGNRGWYPQVALKRRFAFNELSEYDGLKKIEQFVSSEPLFTVNFGQRLQPPTMPVEVIEVVDSPEVVRFHQDFIKAMASDILSKFPEREDVNYYPHMTITWNGENVVDTKEFVGQKRVVSKIVVLKDDGTAGDSRAYQTFSLRS
jgi:hypothetical protein